MKRHLLLLASIIIITASCTKKPGSYPPEPQIYYQSTTPNNVNLEDTASKVQIVLKFTDGDGNIGHNDNDQNIYLRDSRDTSSDKDFTYQYPFPVIEDYMRPSKGGLEGFIAINLTAGYFSITDSLHLALRKDTLHYDIYIKDEAGNKSNVVSTIPIYIAF